MHLNLAFKKFTCLAFSLFVLSSCGAYDKVGQTNSPLAKSVEGVTVEPQIIQSHSHLHVNHHVKSIILDEKSMAEPQSKQVPTDSGPPTEFAPDFCAGLPAGECFTLVIQIPGATLEQNAGLNSLNIIRYSQLYRGLLQQNCSEGLAVGLPKLNRSLPFWWHGSSRKIFTKVKKARCVFQTLSKEEETAPQLASNELGLSVRLFDFDLQGKAISTQPAFGKIEFDRTILRSGFYNVHSSALDSEGKVTWEPVSGGWSMGRNDGVLRQAAFSIRFNSKLGFSADLEGALGYLNHSMGPVLNAARSARNVGELGQFGMELNAIRQSVATIAAGANPVVPSLVLMGLAVRAIQDMCHYEKSDCKVQNSGVDLNDVISAHFLGGTPISSETVANFSDGIKSLPLGILATVMRHADSAGLVRQLKRN